ncbi:NADH-quinone oxidoreductase subunit NuoG [Pseudomarimonas salicorniae]|uniref:NADH-quinone oxidoreductase n=1 Tax=Pseudomarimonas salicorniae TaxID=2933270 RepID=A0ABT0GJH1_9GAMM|nr:NADH-quinone oxidoreductase subunit NuoG [Lysobacter sp. CAU 1642]
MSAQPSTPSTPPDHVNIEIDGVAMTAPKGSMVIQAADKAGIAIPRFCYHEKLPIAANCRMCLVDVEKAPKPMPACATPVMEGMKVYTQSKRALDSQRNVMEFLLINHPLDCPICDQGGECELQDVAMGYGRSVSRFVERKRVVPDEDIGPLVATDMTRCIHCTRCVRFSTEIAGTMELGGMGRGENLSIGTYIGKSIESELSGNLIDVCPVGALTNKPFRFRARAWELTAREGIGSHDALGSNLFMHVRRGEVLRVVPRANESINESWLADRDRYAHWGLKSEDRLSVPMIRNGEGWREASWSEALAAAAEALKKVPAANLGMLVHPGTSNEEGRLLAALAKGLGCANLDHRLQLADFSDGAVAKAFEASLEDVEQSDCILVIGGNPRREAPILGHRVRKAWKQGAKVIHIDALDENLNVELAHKLIRDPQGLVDALLALGHGLGEDGKQSPPAGLAAALGDARADESTKAIAETLRKAQRPVVLLGELCLNHAQGSWLRQAARHVANCLGAPLNQLWAGSNALGLVGEGVLPAARDAADMADKGCEAFLLYGIEPDLDGSHAAALMKSLASAQQVVAFTAFAGEAIRSVAKVLLPIAAAEEMAANYTNALGKTQRTQAGAKAPGEAREGWKVLRALGEVLQVPGFDFLSPEGLETVGAPAQGERELPKRAQQGEGLVRIASTGIYRCDASVRRAAPLQSHPLNRAAQVRMHPEDALARGLSAGGIVKLDDGRGKASLPLAVDAAVARGAIWIENVDAATAALAGTGHTLTLAKA